MQRKWMMILLGSYLCFTGCQVMPHAKGLQSPLWQTQAYQRQDQVEVQWKKQSFSFLLYQQQQGTVLDMVALSLTGQQLFKLQFDGQRVHVEQRIDQMRLLPFEFVVRDLLFATYPKFSSLGQQAVEMKQQADNQVIYIDKQPVLHIKKDQGSIELLNQQVPYSMTLSSIENTLQPQKSSTP
ncbi:MULTISPECIES: DUF3261 domain-containing protein [Acinetobacter]|uniref:DUF3261 domain-containing protein n=1 Tax=Acinetobacter TaxID=469 RepID=UPI0005EBB521|nr:MULTISPECIES: DUF3261 domain-containing protein [Acinetobacter]PVA03595.1 DUF3261 domain-containing protein [Acinetobacter nosocomialis]HCQ60728.1 DUF3261 domain-containing protein [Acinetobacter nosocomialis]